MAGKEKVSLDLPRLSTEFEDRGAHQLDTSEGEDDHFSDALSGNASPIPRTRIEKIDDVPSHGEVPNTTAWVQRLQDAVPDEIEIVPEGSRSRSASSAHSRPYTPSGTPIPRTVIDRIDLAPSHGDVPGTEAYDKRRADAIPDLVRQTSNESASKSEETLVTRVDHKAVYGAAERLRREGSAPDSGEVVGDVPSSPTNDLSRSEHRSHVRRKSTLIDRGGGDAGDDGFGDDFDDFEEGEQGAGDDFGDFDDGFDEPSFEEEPQPSPVPTFVPSPYPLLDVDDLQSMSDLLPATSSHFDAMFPATADLDSIALPEPIPDSSPIFPSERSRSLWKQLLTPPPLQPPNWTKSRIRRLFLVSLGVPVDLDEILPPSKQKKLVLPDINLEGSRRSESGPAIGAVERLKKNANDSSQSLSSERSSSKTRRKGGRKGPEPPPELDLSEVKRLCATTNEKLDGFTDQEIKGHVSQLEEITTKTSELLEYWLKRRDMARAEKEAFEGVIENLVRHARRVRK